MQSVLDDPSDALFFAYVCFGPPHYPMEMPDYLKRMYNPADITLPAGTPDPAAQQAFIKKCVAYDFDGDFELLEKSHAANDTKKPGEVETEEDIRTFVAEYYEMLSNVDHNVSILLN